MKQTIFSLIFSCFIFYADCDEINKLAYQPWYTGSLLSFDGENTPKNVVATQPYLIVTTNYGQYNNSFSNENIPNEIVVNPLNVLFYGFTDFWDMELTLATTSRFKNGQSSTNFSDISLVFGFQLMKETKQRPYVRLIVQEIFPTGKHDNLSQSKNETGLSGMGSFVTAIGIATKKTHHKFYNHPFQTRWNFLVNIPSKTSIKGISFYGGAPDTNGTVKDGISFFFLFSPEISLTQRWAITADIIYIKQLDGSFSGNFGTNPDGSQAFINIFQEDSFQLAPAIEYNFSEKFGLIAGVWFSVFGRNTNAFLSGIISAVLTF